MESVKIKTAPLICEVGNCNGTPYWALHVNAEDAPTFPGGSRTLYVCDHHRMTELDAVRGWCFKHKAEPVELHG